MTVSRIPGLAEDVLLAFDDDLFPAGESPNSKGIGANAEKVHSARLYSEFREAGEGIDAEPFAVENKLHECVENAVSKCVLVKGLAGVGKTTLIRYYLHTYRRTLTNDQPQLVLWVDLKNKGNAYKVQTDFFRAIYSRLDRCYGERFAIEPSLWERNIKKFVPGADSQDISEVIQSEFVRQEMTKWAQQKETVVEEFVARWRQENPGGVVYLVVDNMDTMDFPLQNDTLKFVLDTISPQESDFGNSLSCTFITIRPETLAGYNIGQQLAIAGTPLALPPLVMRKGLGKRLSFIGKRIDNNKRQLQSFIVANVPKLDDTEFANDTNKWHKIPSDKLPNTFQMLNLSSHREVVRLFEILRRSIDAAFDAVESATDFSDLEGARREEAWTVFRSLCGRSMRRSVQLARAVMGSPGMMQSAIYDGRFTAYVFLDAVITQSPNNASNYVSNVFNIGITDPEAVVFTPYLLQVLMNYIERVPVDADEFALAAVSKKFVYREDLEHRLEKLGFTKGIIELGLRQARERRFLTGVFGQEDTVAGYVLNQNLVFAHYTLLMEPAYTDNMAQDEQVIAQLLEVKPTRGFHPNDLGRRVANSLRFIEWVIKNEQAFLKRQSVINCRSALHEEKIRSVAHGMTWNYLVRLFKIEKNSKVPQSARNAFPQVTSRLLELGRHWGLSRSKTLRNKFEALLAADLIEILARKPSES